MTSPSPSPRTRRQPPPFRRVEVRTVERPTPRLVRITLAGPELEGLTIERPAASVRLLVPSPGEGSPAEGSPAEGSPAECSPAEGTPGEGALVIPAWNGNEFLLPDGARPALRTFTPRRVGRTTLDLEIVVHGSGPASGWADAARPGDPAAVSGPGRGYEIDENATSFLLAGDETAIPAIGQLLEVLPTDRPVHVHIEVGHPDARLDLPDHPQATVEWHDLPAGAPPGDAMVGAVLATDLAPGARVWVAGEAAAVQRIRRHLFEELGLPRAQAWVRGYWKHGRHGDAEDDQ